MERQEIMENNFTFKDNTFLIDGEILHQCIINNKKYMSVDNEIIRKMMLRFDSLLARSKGRFYNIDNLKKIKNIMRDGIEDISLINNIWADRALKIVSSTDGDWESLDSSALTLIEDNNEKWHALFHNDFEGNDSAIEIAKKRNNHINC